MAYIDELNKYAKDLYKNKDDLEVEKVKKELDAPLVLSQENRKKVIGSSTNKEGKTEYYFDDGSFVTAPNEQEAVREADRMASKKFGSNPMISTPEMPVMGVFGETGSKKEAPEPYKDVETESYLKKDVKESQDPYLKLINSLPKKKESSWKDIIGDALTLAVPTLVGASMDEMATGAKIGADYTLSNIKGRRERENAYEDMLNKQAFDLSKERAKSKTSQEWERNKELDKVGFFEDTKTGNIISMTNRQAIANGTRLRPLEKGRFGQNSKGQVFDTWTGKVVKEQQIDLKDKTEAEREQRLQRQERAKEINAYKLSPKEISTLRGSITAMDNQLTMLQDPDLGPKVAPAVIMSTFREISKEVGNLNAQEGSKLGYDEGALANAKLAYKDFIDGKNRDPERVKFIMPIVKFAMEKRKKEAAQLIQRDVELRKMNQVYVPNVRSDLFTPTYTDIIQNRKDQEVQDDVTEDEILQELGF